MEDLSWLRSTSRKWIDDFKAGNVFEVTFVSGHQWHAILKCSGRDDGVSDFHLLLLTQLDALLNNLFVQSQFGCGCQKGTQLGLTLQRKSSKLRKTQHLDPCHTGDHLIRPLHVGQAERISRLSGMNENVAVANHEAQRLHGFRAARPLGQESHLSIRPWRAGFPALPHV